MRIHRSHCGPTPRRRHHLAIVAGLATVALLAGSLVWWHAVRTVPSHFRTVVPEVLYRSAWPTASQFRALVERYGIRTVVNLCLPDEETSLDGGNWEREEEQCRRLGVRLVHLPLPGNSPPSPEQTREWLRICASPAMQPVLVHCAQGVIRTNGMVAVYQLGVLGMDNATVLGHLPSYGHHLFSPKRQRLNKFILGWGKGGDERRSAGPAHFATAPAVEQGEG